MEKQQGASRRTDEGCLRVGRGMAERQKLHRVKRDNKIDLLLLGSFLKKSCGQQPRLRVLMTHVVECLVPGQ